MITRQINTFLLLLALILSGCQSAEKDRPSTEESSASRQDQNRVRVSRSRFEKNNMELDSLILIPEYNGIRATGVIDVPPENRVSLSPVMGGYVVYNPLLIGDRVSRGDVLLTLENPEFVKLQQEYLETREELKFLEEEYNRHKELLREKITSQKNFLRAESAYKSANARYFGLRKQLELLNIDPDRITPESISPRVEVRAPISGSITRINITKGSFASPSSPALEIINREHLHLELNIFEKDVMRIKKGQDISFRVPEASEETFPARVYLISDALSENRTIRVHGHVADSLRNKLVVGMYVEAVIRDQGEKNQDSLQIAAPASAVVESEGDFFILVLEEETPEALIFKKVSVQKGNEIQERITLPGSNLKENSKVLKKGAFDLIN